jgi:sporulation protein YlmC with PRC-barrel domain
MRLREAYGRKVVSTDDAETIGRLEAFVIDPQKRSVVGLRLAKVRGDRPFLSWSDLQGFGTGAVTVGSADLLRPPADEAEERGASKALQPIGKLVLSELGTALGKVNNVDFDEESGALVSFYLGDAGKVAGDRLLGIGSYAVVVKEAPPEETAAPGGE